MPLLYDGDAPEKVKKVTDLQMAYLEKCQIPVEIYDRYLPQSSKMVPLLEKLCGHLSYDKVQELKKKICFESD